MKPLKNWDDNGNLRVPPVAPQVDASQTVLLYDHKGNSIVREVGFRKLPETKR